MNYRTLGKTGLKVAEIGMGTWQLSGNPWGWAARDENESKNALAKYLEVGGNFIDTAYVYGRPAKSPDRLPSEEFIGKFLKENGKRDSVIIATKIPPKNGNWPALYGVPIEAVFPVDHIEKKVDESLKHLDVDSIDLMQFHVWQDEFANNDEWKNTIEKITKAGKVKHWGISINDYQPSNILKTLDTGLISTVQFIFNIFHQLPVERLFPYAKQNNIGLIARVPFDEGGLLGKFRSGQPIPQTAKETPFVLNEEIVAEYSQRLPELEKLLGSEAKTLAELALRYILSWDAVSTTIPGMSNAKHVEENTGVADGKKLSEETLTALKKLAWERNFYDDHDPALKDSGFIER